MTTCEAPSHRLISPAIVSIVAWSVLLKGQCTSFADPVIEGKGRCIENAVREALTEECALMELDPNSASRGGTAIGDAIRNAVEVFPAGNRRYVS